MAPEGNNSKRVVRNMEDRHVSKNSKSFKQDLTVAKDLTIVL